MDRLMKTIHSWLINKNTVIAALAIFSLYQYVKRKRITVDSASTLALLEAERKMTQTLQQKRDLEQKGRIVAENQLQEVAKGKAEAPSEDLVKLTGHGHMKPIGVLKSVFKERNGTPRQGAVTVDSRAYLKLDVKGIESRHALEGLAEYSHVWLIYVFHRNTNVSRSLKENTSVVRAKVKPPRLNGISVGLFSTRTPHRPNPIGLSCVRLHSIEEETLHFRGIDLLDGTPILDIKPYIPQYDRIESSICPAWVDITKEMVVKWTDTANTQLQDFMPHLEFYHQDEINDVKNAIDQVLRHDIRSNHKAKLHSDQDRSTYGFCFDKLNICCEYVKLESETEVEVSVVEYWPEGPEKNKSKKYKEEHDERKKSKKKKKKEKKNEHEFV